VLLRIGKRQCGQLVIVSSSPQLRNPTDPDVEALLLDPACPRGKGLKEQIVPVLRFIAFAKSRGYATSDIASLTDQCVERLGGERHHLVDPASWIPNLVRRLTGNLPMPSEDVWLLPPRD
jgi:hypothetical protein